MPSTRVWGARRGATPLSLSPLIPTPRRSPDGTSLSHDAWRVPAEFTVGAREILATKHAGWDEGFALVSRDKAT